MKKLFILVVFFGYLTGTTAGEKIITTTDGVDLYIKVAGSGSPLLYLHGGPGSGSYWFEQLTGEFLEKHFTVVYLDQRGVGRSTSPANGDYSLDRMALDFEEVRKALEFENWLTMGHSFGGILQMGYAERYPAAISGMIMINCTIDLNGSACQSWIPKAAELIGESYTCVGDTVPLPQRMNEFGGKLRDKGLFWKMGSDKPGTFPKLDEITSRLPAFNSDQGNHIMNYPEYWKNFKPLTARMSMPVLYFYGTNDFMVGPKHFEEMKFPNLMLWENNGGHIPFIEDKTDLEKAILAYAEKYQF